MSATADKLDRKRGPIASDRLTHFIHRVENLLEERHAIQSDIRDVFAEAKGVGYDVKTMRKLIVLRAMDVADRDEQAALLDTYAHALGMDLGQTVAEPTEDELMERASKVIGEVDRCMDLVGDRNAPPKIEAIKELIGCSTGKAHKLRTLVMDRVREFSRKGPGDRENEKPSPISVAIGLAQAALPQTNKCAESLPGSDDKDVTDHCEMNDDVEGSPCHSRCHEVTSRDHECWAEDCPANHDGSECPLRDVCVVHGKQSRPNADAPSPVEGLGAALKTKCGCWKCANEYADKRRAEGADFSELLFIRGRFFTCETCGNKRCPHSTDHRNACTGSNEPGQPGSRYGGMPELTDSVGAVAPSSARVATPDSNPIPSFLDKRRARVGA